MTVKELLQLVTPFLILAATWLIGQRILTAWDLRKKRLELDIAVASQFQQLYGEAKEVARWWREVTQKDDQHSQPISVPSDIGWQLFARAAAVEGKFEAVVIKLVTERPLLNEHQRILEVVSWISPEMAAWIAHHSTVPGIIAARP